MFIVYEFPSMINRIFHHLESLLKLALKEHVKYYAANESSKDQKDVIVRFVKALVIEHLFCNHCYQKDLASEHEK